MYIVLVRLWVSMYLHIRVRDVLLLLLQQEQQQQEQHDEEEGKQPENVDQEMMFPITKKIDLKQVYNNNITTT